MIVNHCNQSRRGIISLRSTPHLRPATPKTAATARADDAAALQPDHVTDDLGEGEDKHALKMQQPRRGSRRTGRRRVLWFNASHERDIVPLLDSLASARARTYGQQIGGCVNNNSNGSTDGRAQFDDGAPLFDSAWFMEVPPARPSQVTPPTAQEILAPHGLGAASSGAHACTSAEGERGDTAPEVREAGTAVWQRTLEQVLLFRLFNVFAAAISIGATLWSSFEFQQFCAPMALPNPIVR